MKTPNITKSRVIFFLLACVSTMAIKPASAERRGMMLATFKGNTQSVVNRVRTDISVLALEGANIVRCPIYWRDRNNFPNRAAQDEHWLTIARAAVDECQRTGMICVIDFHDSVRGIAGSNRMPNMSDFLNRWKLFAETFEPIGRGNQIWFDVLNEPGPNIDWNNLALRTSQAIRKVNSKHFIVYSGRGATTADAESFRPLPGISKQIAGFHVYDWTKLQHQPTVAGGSVRDRLRYGPGQYRRKKDLRAILEKVANVEKRTGHRVYIGETAISRYHPDAELFLKDFTDICRELKIDVTLHAYREDPMWSYSDNEAQWKIVTDWFNFGR